MRKIAIVGTAPSNSEAPYSDPSWEIWGMNGLWAIAPRVTRWFEMHPPDESAIAFWYGESFPRWLKSCGVPVYMHRRVEWVPTSVEYPRPEVEAEFGKVFACTPCWAMGLALLEGDVEELAIYGIDMTGTGEYLAQREWVQYLRGLAVGRGIKVTLPRAASLAEAPFAYGYELGPQVPECVPTAIEREQECAKAKYMNATVTMHQLEGGKRVLGGIVQYLRSGGTADEGYCQQAALELEERRLRAAVERANAEGSIQSTGRLLRQVAHAEDHATCALCRRPRQEKAGG